MIRTNHGKSRSLSWFIFRFRDLRFRSNLWRCANMSSGIFFAKNLLYFGWCLWEDTKTSLIRIYGCYSRWVGNNNSNEFVCVLSFYKRRHFISFKITNSASFHYNTYFCWCLIITNKNIRNCDARFLANYIFICQYWFIQISKNNSKKLQKCHISVFTILCVVSRNQSIFCF